MILNEQHSEMILACSYFFLGGRFESIHFIRDEPRVIQAFLFVCFVLVKDMRLSREERSLPKGQGY